MSKKCKVSYDATHDVANDILNRMDDFYQSHPDAEDHILLYFKQIIRLVITGWKKRMINRHPRDFNTQIAQCTDLSKRQIERFPLKN